MYIDISTRTELASKEDAINELFTASFQQGLARDDWSWFYLDNPSGPAYVSLFYENDQLLGHYAVIPITLAQNGTSLTGYRSMTTMVHPVGRGRGLFTALASRVYKMLADDGAALVYGFPNANSAPGFSRHLEWTMEAPDRLIDVRGQTLLSNPELIDVLTTTNGLTWDSSHGEQKRWRVSRPGVSYAEFPGLVTKPYNEVQVILHIEPDGLAQIKPELTYRVLVPHEFDQQSLDVHASLDYQFGVRYFKEEFAGSTIKREPILSDIF